MGPRKVKMLSHNIILSTPGSFTGTVKWRDSESWVADVVLDYER